MAEIANIVELRERGIIVISSEISSKTMEIAVEKIIYINELEKPKFKNIQIILNSGGGTCNSGFMLIDIIEYSKIPVYITGLGMCGSMGNLILCSGEKGHRTITKNTSLLFHQYSWGNWGKYHELVAAQKEIKISHERIVNHYLKHTNLDKKEIKKYLLPASDVWLKPEEALKYGIVDKILD